jgi:hypothetical protein
VSPTPASSVPDPQPPGLSASLTETKNTAENTNWDPDAPDPTAYSIRGYPNGLLL